MWSVGQVQSIQDGIGEFSGSGFTILDEKKRPLIAFGYGNCEEAEEAAKYVKAALSKACFVGGGNR